jgi:replicative DNA helicase
VREGPNIPLLKPLPLRLLLQEVTQGASAQAVQAGHVPTGFSDLDQLTGGLISGPLWVISGRSGAGKSVLVTDLIRSAAVRGGSGTLLITRSEAPAEVVKRVLAAEARVPLHHMTFGLSGDEEARLDKVKERLLEVPLLLVHGQVLDLPGIDAQVASQAAQQPQRLLLVDDLPAGPDQVEMLVELRALAVEHQVAVVAVVQEDVGDSERQLRRIEQIADVALTVHRDDQTDFESPRLGEADFIVTRHRHGPVAKILVHFQGHYGRFVDPAREWA